MNGLFRFRKGRKEQREHRLASRLAWWMLFENTVWRKTIEKDIKKSLKLKVLNRTTT